MIIRPFSPSDQLATKQLILNGLEEYWGELDPPLNPDFAHITASHQEGCFVAAEDGGMISKRKLRFCPLCPGYLRVVAELMPHLRKVF